jgi:hypothetical protein
MAIIFCLSALILFCLDLGSGGYTSLVTASLVGLLGVVLYLAIPLFDESEVRKQAAFLGALWLLLLPLSAFVFGGLNLLLPWPTSGWVIVALLAVILIIMAWVSRDEMADYYGLFGVVLISVVATGLGINRIEAPAAGWVMLAAVTILINACVWIVVGTNRYRTTLRSRRSQLYQVAWNLYTISALVLGLIVLEVPSSLVAGSIAAAVIALLYFLEWGENVRSHTL